MTYQEIQDYYLLSLSADVRNALGSVQSTSMEQVVDGITHYCNYSNGAIY